MSVITILNGFLNPRRSQQVQKKQAVKEMLKNWTLTILIEYAKDIYDFERCASLYSLHLHICTALQIRFYREQNDLNKKNFLFWTVHTPLYCI